MENTKANPSAPASAVRENRAMTLRVGGELVVGTEESMLINSEVIRGQVSRVRFCQPIGGAEKL